MKTEVVFIRRAYDSPWHIMYYVNIETLRVGRLFYEGHPRTFQMYEKVILEDYL